MGNAAARCSDVSMGNAAGGLGANKPLEASSSEESEEGSEEEDESDGDDADARTDAEEALKEGLKRGKTSIFKETIDHATAVGIDEEKILKAEAKLEEHKSNRRREAFEADVRDFLENEESQDQAACEEKIRLGQDYKVNEKILKQLQDRIMELEVKRELTKEELSKTMEFIEICTRRFVGDCMKGRGTMWVDLASGKKQKAAIHLDAILKNVSILDANQNELGAMPVMDASCRRAADVEEVSGAKGFGSLDEKDRENAVAITGKDEPPPWCIVESRQEEVVIALHILSGAVSGGGAAVPKREAPKARDADEEDHAAPAMSPRGAKSPKGAKRDMQRQASAAKKELAGKKAPDKKKEKEETDHKHKHKKEKVAAAAQEEEEVEEGKEEAEEEEDE